MGQVIEWSRLLGGLGAFLLGMHLLETGLEQLGGSSFSRLLRKATRTPLLGIFWGTVATALLQSSSLVSLMVVALVGAGILTLAQAFGLIMGANIGTTATGWLVTLLGFKLNIEELALWGLGIGAFLAVIWNYKRWLQLSGQAIAGFALLFIGLEWMKNAIARFAEVVDLSAWQDAGSLTLFVFGFVLTAIIQSSSATMAITLSAMHAGILGFYQGAALMIGADLGTTITVFLGTLDGNVAKRQVALTHFLYNLIVNLIAFALLPWEIAAVEKLLGITDPLLALVTFHSGMNILGAVLFLPFIRPFMRLIERLVKPKKKTEAHFIHRVPVSQTDAALIALQKEVVHLAERVLAWGRLLWGLGEAAGAGEPTVVYASIKQLGSEIIAYIVQLQQHMKTEANAQNLTGLLWSVRRLLRAAKSLKDIRHNIEHYRHDEREAVQLLLAHMREQVATTLAALEEKKEFWLQSQDLVMQALWERNRQWQQQLNEEVLQGTVLYGLNEAATFLNMIHENKEYLESVIEALEGKPDTEYWQETVA
ncbi:MAG: sodium:phosphate symporter [Thermonema sp.]|uniref:Na/Pi cotransporter family protein n=1 Tax=Thermonema sp. TaxID=2231181 RepID=UPI0021DCC53E|nr:Na/Pi symporter [Thermonema sp.]GIV40685.1 MAG: sodium:phosphate symporter [Thermonema sp.]